MPTLASSSTAPLATSAHGAQSGEYTAHQDHPATGATFSTFATYRAIVAATIIPMVAVRIVVFLTSWE